jgi:hypothetical protein
VNNCVTVETVLRRLWPGGESVHYSDLPNAVSITKTFKSSVLNVKAAGSSET